MMDRKLIPPASTFIAGAGLWLVFVLLGLFGVSSTTGITWLGTAVSIVTAVLLVVSGLLCLSVDGPAAGQIVRMVILLGLAVYAHYQVGSTAALVALAAAAVELLLSIRAFTRRGTGKS